MAIHSAWPGPAAPSALNEPLERMGQPLFAPPNVKGWIGGKTWLNNSTLLARNNFAEQVAMGGSGLRTSDGRSVRLTEAPKKEAFIDEKSPKESPELPPPDTNFDVVKRFDMKKTSEPALLVKRLGELFLPSYLPDRANRSCKRFLPKESQRARNSMCAFARLLMRSCACRNTSCVERVFYAQDRRRRHPAAESLQTASGSRRYDPFQPRSGGILPPRVCRRRLEAAATIVA